MALPGFPAVSARALLAGFAQLGLDADGLRQEAVLDADAMARLDGMLDANAFGRLWEAGARRLPREELPTEVGLAVPFGAFGALDYLAGSSPDVETAFTRLAEHFRQVSLLFSLEAGTAEDGSGVVRILTPAPYLGQETSEAFTLALVVGRFRVSSDGVFKVSAVRLTRPAPAHPSRHPALPGAPVSTGCSVPALEIPRQSWRLALRSRDPVLQETLRNLVAHVGLGTAPGDLEAAVRTRWCSLLPAGTPSAADVAAAMGLSERTVQPPPGRDWHLLHPRAGRLPGG